MAELPQSRINERNITSEMRESFLDYAMSVIVSRALPDVRDGLKPVHRRILYGLNEQGMTPDKPYKKSARIVGDVMGKYHPHGDSSIYEAMVRMAQDFSYRYPLVDGQGNFGSMDGDGAAAMRYTEARMTKITLELLRDINKVQKAWGSEMGTLLDTWEDLHSRMDHVPFDWRYTGLVGPGLVHVSRPWHRHGSSTRTGVVDGIRACDRDLHRSHAGVFQLQGPISAARFSGISASGEIA